MTMATHDHLGRPLIAITGVGVVSSLGRGKKANWDKLTAGQSGIHRIERFLTDDLKTTVAGTVDFMELERHSAPALSYALAEAASDEATEQAGLDAGEFPGPLFLASPPVEIEWQHRFELDKAIGHQGDPGYATLIEASRKGDHKNLYELLQFGRTADLLSDRYGTSGLPISLSTACASGATAVQLGVEAIRRGETEAALCVGTDGSVTMEALIRFSLLSALTTQNEDPTKAAKPFSKDRDGFVMAEGAGSLVLESVAHAQARGATILAILRGAGEKADHFHRTRSSPDGSPVIAAVSRAI
ncbi:MAG: beta-ketoacyl synthase N-terminal-like domain-containing protein, partial [Pseudomonadota bacterium]